MVYYRAGMGVGSPLGEGRLDGSISRESFYRFLKKTSIIMVKVIKKPY